MRAGGCLFQTKQPVPEMLEADGRDRCHSGGRMKDDPESGGVGGRRYKISGNSASGTYLPSDFCGRQLAGGRGKAGRKNEEICPAVEGNRGSQREGETF